MRITVPVEIIRLTVPTCTPSRDKPLVIVSPLELGGDGLHIFVWVVQLVGCQGSLLWEHRRLTALAQAVGAGCSCRVARIVNPKKSIQFREPLKMLSFQNYI